MKNVFENTWIFCKKWWWGILYLLGYFFVVNIVVLNRFWQYEGLYMDHGFFDSALWQAAHGKTPLIDLVGHFPINQLGDHFAPTMYLLTPLYWITDNYSALLIVGTVFVLVGLGIFFFLSTRLIHSQLMIFALLVSSSLFIGLQNAEIANYHNDVFAIATLALALLALTYKRWGAFWVFLALTTGLKENFTAVGVGLGIYLCFKGERWRGIAAIGLSIFYYLVVVGYVIPGLSGYSYPYAATDLSVSKLITGMFNDYRKIETMTVSLLTFGLLPLSSLSFLPTLIQDWFARFVLNNGSARWDLGLHYNALTTVLLAFGSITGVAVLEKFSLYKRVVKIHAILIICLVVFFHLRYHGPLALVYNKAFLPHTQTMRFIDPLIFEARKDRNGLMMAQNNLGAYLTHREKIMLLRDDYFNYSPDWIVVDKRPGQNPNNFWPVPSGNIDNLVAKLATDSAYTKIGVSEDQLIFKRNHQSL